MAEHIPRCTPLCNCDSKRLRLGVPCGGLYHDIGVKYVDKIEAFEKRVLGIKDNEDTSHGRETI